uniref:E3 ubiquitin-protein ligase RNF220 n=1 Tax=Hydra vulgaris TaxID=6087 RepID=T2MCG5_HYDVU
MEILGRRKKVNRKEHSQVCAINRLERKRPKTSIFLCPVCSLTIRGKHEFERHYKEEIKMTSIRDLGQLIKTKTLKKKNCLPDGEESSSEKMLLEDREEALQNIKKRKYSRYSNMYIMSLSNQKLIEKSHSGHTDKETTEYAAQEITDSVEEDNYISCVVCNEFLNPTNGCTLNHLSKCLSQKKNEFNIYISSDDEQDEVVEEFSWAGQTWIRTSSLVDSEFLRREGKLMRLEMEDGDEELDVDGDTLEENFGTSQFSDADIVLCSSSSLSDKNQKLLSSKEEFPTSDKPVTTAEEFLTLEQLEKSAGANSEKLIELLKFEIRKLGTHLDNALKCSICVGPYINPLVSTSCWHVCCTDCWLRSLGTKKMCPICGSIVSSAHLRKIFL